MTTFPVAALDNPLNLAVLLVLAVLLFGKQLPDVMRTFGKGVRELRQAANFEEMGDALKAVNEIRGVATTTAVVRAAVPGAAEIQDSLAETKGVVDAPVEVAPLVREAPAEEEAAAPQYLPPSAVPSPPPQTAPPLPMPSNLPGGTPLPYPADPWVERPLRPVVPAEEVEPDTEND